ncbi:endonuclease/exonuclease/phosphatase family protein [Francisellaceae bacterium]|nr:endonuclease/exonuclease/phosphatase family protein [Francisellaceae bacterium]
MFKPSNTVTICCPDGIKEVLPRELGILTWNIYKKNRTNKFNESLSLIHSKYPANILLFQEASQPDQAESFIKGYETLHLSNLQMKNRAFGVSTVSCTKHISNSYLISHHQEFLLQTHKSLLISVYVLSNQQQLVVVNIHAINFKNLKAYEHEIDILVDSISEHEGPMIISGDFNTWSKGRHRVIENMSSKLNLSRVHFENSINIKRFLKYPLDLMFYRGLEITFASSLDCGKVSDHNPLYARFILPE